MNLGGRTICLALPAPAMSRFDLPIDRRVRANLRGADADRESNTVFAAYIAYLNVSRSK